MRKEALLGLLPIVGTVAWLAATPTRIGAG